MAKLNKKMQDEVANAPTNNFEPIPAGRYHARLRGVNTDGSGNAGPYWTWEYEVVGGEHKNRRLWNTTSLSQAWALKQSFEAFGVDPDADTDELCGQIVQLQVSQRTIQAGARKGEMGNQVDRVLPADPEFVVEDDDGAGAEKEESIF